jgi:hypothetical protein
MLFEVDGFAAHALDDLGDLIKPKSNARAALSCKSIALATRSGTRTP